jgi:hypothetical protein
MDTEEADLNPTPARTDSAQTSESVEISKSENRIEKEPSYMRSRQIALKKFTLAEGKPSWSAVARSLRFCDRKLFLRRGSSVHTAAQSWIRSSARPNAFHNAKSLGIIALHSSLTVASRKSAHCGAKTFDGIAPNPEGLFKACSKISPWQRRFSGPVAESQRFPSQKEPSGFFAKHSKCASGSALTILARRENPPNGGCEQFRLGTENDRDQA